MLCENLQFNSLNSNHPYCPYMVVIRSNHPKRSRIFRAHSLGYAKYIRSYFYTCHGTIFRVMNWSYRRWAKWNRQKVDTGGHRTEKT
jgi:hypothetical protein